MATLPSPIALWDERPDAGVASTLARLVPYKRTDGVWVFLAQGTAPPVGAVPGALVVQADGFTRLLTSTTTGQRLTRAAGGPVFQYSQPQLVRFRVGESLSGGMLTRATVASYTDDTSAPLVRYAVAGSLAGWTMTRTTVATYTGDV